MTTHHKEPRDSEEVRVRNGGNVLSRLVKENYPIMAFIALLEAGQIFVTKKVVSDILVTQAITKEVYQAHLDADQKAMVSMQASSAKQWEIIGGLKDRVTTLEAELKTKKDK